MFHSSSPSDFRLVMHGTKDECKGEYVDAEILKVLSASEVGLTAEDIAKSLNSPVLTIQNRLTFMVRDNRVTVIGKKGKAHVYGSDRELLAG